MEELQVQAATCKVTFSFMHSMSLKCAVELGIPDAIHRHGGAISLADLATGLQIPPSKTLALGRLMRALVHFGCFDEDENHRYRLTAFSAHLLHHNRRSSWPYVLAMLHPALLSPWQCLSSWLRGDERTPFVVAHGMEFYALGAKDGELSGLFNEAMASDSRLVGEVLVKECAEVFAGVNSVVDVGGGSGTLAGIIKEAFPDVKCSVLELPHVVAAAAAAGAVEYVAGDMFEGVPPADAVLLKRIMRDWSNEDCVKILKKCKEAVPSKENGGKVIIIDMVIGKEDTVNKKTIETQVMFDMLMMVLTGGTQREEGEWERIFIDAGFSGYKIVKVLSLLSVIEIYP